MKRIILSLIISISCFSIPLLVWSKDVLVREELNIIIDNVIKNNPKIHSLVKRLEGAKARIPQASSLEDPKVRFDLDAIPLDTLSFSDEGMTQKMVSIMQNLPFPGKLSLRKDVAVKEMEMINAELDNLKRELIRDTKLAYYDLCFTGISIELTKKNKGLLENFIKIAEAKYSVGKGIQQDVIKAQVELSRLIQELIVLEKERERLHALLSSLMYRDLKRPLKYHLIIEKTDFDYPYQYVEEVLIENNPILKMTMLSLDKSKKLKELAEKAYYPDFDVMLSYGQRDYRTDTISSSITLSIPLWHKTKQDKQRLEAINNIEEVKDAYNDLKNNLLFGLKNLMLEEEKDSRLIILFKDGIIPQATQSLESALASYQVNKVDFLTLLNNQATLYNHEIEYQRIVIDHEKVLAMIESIIGIALY